jgi:AhpD family alkylhydroperoxidase
MEPISRFPVPEIADLPDDLRERILQVQDKTGFVPNVFLAMAHRPAELRAFLAYHDALMEADGPLSKAEREMIVVATSAARSCTYCVVAHGAILRIRARDPQVADLVATNHRTGRAAGPAAPDARLRGAPVDHPGAGRGRRPRGAAAAPASTTRRSGTSAPSPASSRCRTGWRT